MGGTGWFVESELERRLEGLAHWHPVIQTERGCFDLDVWFSSWNECYEFIETHVAGVGVI